MLVILRFRPFADIRVVAEIVHAGNAIKRKR